MSTSKLYLVAFLSLSLFTYSCSIGKFSLGDVPFDTGISQAVTDGDVEALKLAIVQGEAVDTVDNTGSQPIHIAAKNNYPDIMAILVEHGAKLDAVDGNGNQPIHIAALAEANDALEWILAKGMDPETLNRAGRTPVQELIVSNKSASLNLLIEHGASVNYTDASNDSLIHYAVAAANAKAVRELLALGAIPDLVNDNGFTPIQLSAQLTRQNDVLTALAQAGADINQADAQGNAPIHLSIMATPEKSLQRLDELGLPRTLKIRALSETSLQTLINLGADLDALDGQEEDVMQLAVRSNNPQAIEILQAAGKPLDEYNSEGYAPIHQAVVLQNKAALGKLLDLGVDLEQPVEGKGTTALLLSARLGFNKFQKILQDSGASIDARDRAGNTILHYAARFDQQKAITTAITAGADINSINLRRETPLHTAVLAKSHSALKQLLKSGADTSFEDAVGDRPLHKAIKYDHTNDVRILLSDKDNKADPNALNGKGISTLTLAIIKSDAPTNLIALLKAGANPNTANNNGWYPLHQAAYLGKPKAIIVLARYNHKLNVLTPQGDTAMHLASRKNNFLSIRALAKAGADLNNINALSNTPLHTAVIANADNSISELLDLGANIYLRDADVRTPLIKAITKGSTNAVTLLMQADPQAQRDPDGNTPILLAMQQNNDAMVKHLLQLGASPNAANFIGTKPLPLALKKHQYQLAEQLVSHGADITEPLDIEGNTACDESSDENWLLFCRQYYIDSTYLDQRKRWLNIGQTKQYSFSKWSKRIPIKKPQSNEVVTNIRKQADYQMRYYLAFSDPDKYLTELKPPEEQPYEITKLANESDQAYIERSNYIKLTFQEKYQKQFQHYSKVKLERLQQIATFKNYNNNTLPSRARVAIDFNSDAIQRYLRQPLKATSVEYDKFEGVLRLKLENNGFVITPEIRDVKFKAQAQYIADNATRLPWYMGALVETESFTITHLIVPTPNLKIYLPLDGDEYKYLLQRFISLRGLETYDPDL